MNEILDKARLAMRNARRVAVLTGAGISAESGVPTYRGSGGLWSGFSSADLASPEGFARDPHKVWDWHNDRRMSLAQVKPNAGHLALAQLEQQLQARGATWTLATQNVDGLHQAAGSTNVLELHGTILAIRCNGCGLGRRVGFEPIAELPHCSCGGLMRPDIVWFGEMLPQTVWRAAVRSCQECDVMLTVGTSAQVYPAASLIEVAAENGAATIEVNLEPTAASGLVTYALHGKAGTILPQLV